MRPCFACGHVHLEGSRGSCWEAACDPSCPAEHSGGEPFTYAPLEGS